MSADRRLVLTSLFDEPRLSLAILGAGAAHVGLTAMGLEGWPCPFYKATGWPCPGCGLGRASVMMLKGDWRNGLRWHAFAPVLLLVLTVLAGGLILPGRSKAALRKRICWLEKELYLGAVLLFGLIAYWLLRLVLDATHWQMLAS